MSHPLPVRPPARRHRALLLGCATALTVVLAACGGTTSAATSTTSTTSTTASTAAGNRRAALAAYDSCMTSHGVPESALTRPNRGPTPGVTRTLPAGVTQAQYTAAQQACRSKLPAGGFGGGFGGANSAAVAAYRNCLQINGVTLPTPGSTTSTSAGSSSGSSTTTAAGSGGRGFGGLNTSNPTVAKALAACARLRPARTGSTTSVTS